MKTLATTKTVTVLNTYRFKNVARICFVVESSNGEDQYNCCFNGDVNHASCGCDRFVKGHKGCYHIDQLRPIAQAYFEARKPVAAHVQPVQREDWKETAQFGGQSHKMEMAPSGHLVPMR